MNRHLFLSFTLVLTLLWMQFYAAVRENFNGVNEYQDQIVHLESKLENQRLKFELAREEFTDFRQNVATLMPDLLKNQGLGEENYPIRSLASQITKSESEKIKVTIAKTLFETGKEHFREKRYQSAKASFKKIISRFGYTTYVPESFFLLAESQFLENELEDSVETIQSMMELFPTHELTGLALVRLGRIYEIENRNEEAVEIYKTVLKTFPQRDVASQAKASLRGMDL